jgi:hypothetical protein
MKIWLKGFCLKIFSLKNFSILANWNNNCHKINKYEVGSWNFFKIKLKSKFQPLWWVITAYEIPTWIWQISLNTNWLIHTEWFSIRFGPQLNWSLPLLLQLSLVLAQPIFRILKFHQVIWVFLMPLHIEEFLVILLSSCTLFSK